MDCAEAREHLSELDRGHLPAEIAAAVSAHVDTCAACAAARRVDAELRALLRAEAPRYTAPAALRARIAALVATAAPRPAAPARSVGWRSWLVGPRWAGRAAVGAVAVVLLVWAGSLWMGQDPVARLAVRAVEEHGEYVQATMTRPAPDPQAVVRDLQGRVGFPIAPVFLGDSQVHVIAGKVSELSGTRAATVIYRDDSGRYSTLFLLPAAGIVIPAAGRLPIDTFTPYHRVLAQRQLLLWQQGRLACLLVSDLDQAGAAAMFLKIRRATEGS